ncbi:MAG TPA: hypothetical protein VN901_28540 [Candidatus Acidoferrales bacterium]|nr:hypothetical protein [Candidatus Acidoferrales bacterium]
MRDQLERILKDWDARLTRTGNGKPARLLESLPHDVIGSNASRLTAKHIGSALGALVLLAIPKGTLELVIAVAMIGVVVPKS